MSTRTLVETYLRTWRRLENKHEEQNGLPNMDDVKALGSSAVQDAVNVQNLSSVLPGFLQSYISTLQQIPSTALAKTLAISEEALEINRLLKASGMRLCDSVSFPNGISCSHPGSL